MWRPAVTVALGLRNFVCKIIHGEISRRGRRATRKHDAGVRADDDDVYAVVEI